MKSIFTTLSVAVILTACNNAQPIAATAQVPADTLNAHTAAADRASLTDASTLSDTLYTSNGQYVRVDALPKQNAVKQPRRIAKTYTPVATRPVAQPAPVYTPPVETPQTAPSAPAETAASGTGTTGNETSGAGEATNETVATAPVEEKKKGWSKAAKGAVIGGATGAVAGAIIGKNKAAGAVIGGIIGAGGGYAIGRSKDKKDGR